MHWYGFVSFDAADSPFGIGRTVADCAGIGRLVGTPVILNVSHDSFEKNIKQAS